MHHVDMTTDWGRLGQAVERAYQRLGLSHTAFADHAGVSRSTLHRLERGNGPAPSDTTLAKVELALGWPAGSARKVVEGADAPEGATTIPLPSVRPASASSVVEQLPVQIRDELYQDGELLGVDVVDLGPDGSGARMIVVLKRDPGDAEPDPETLRATLDEWQRKRRELWRQGDAPPS
jgi:transcriptional regulator with XRE-family HTH domain